MDQGELVVLDIVAVTILAVGLYFPRYRRKDIMVAILGLNVGVLSIAIALVSSTVSAGFGLGLFGVLSIVRLRSNELDQEEVAYYFTAIAIGLLAGFDVDPDWVTPVMTTLIIAVLFVWDHPRLFATTRHQSVRLDEAITDEAALIARLEELLGGKVLRVKVKKVDLLVNTTSVDVRYRVGGARAEIRP